MDNTTTTPFIQTKAALPTQRLIWNPTQQAFHLPGEVHLGKAATEQTALRPTNLKQTGPYLLGPIPLDWLAAAHALGGQCLAIGMLLWHQSKLTNKPIVWLPRKLRANFGLSDRSYYTAMQRLETAGLVSITRASGKSLKTTLNPAPASAINA